MAGRKLLAAVDAGEIAVVVTHEIVPVTLVTWS